MPLPGALFSAPAYASLRRTHLRLRELAGSPPYAVTMGAPQPHGQDLRGGCAPAILDLAKEGLQLSRFKGLGEMNPDQLRETTMNPATRTLQQVTIEDAAAADELFTMLMGDNVEPRRKFIEQHARDVKFLDV